MLHVTWKFRDQHTKAQSTSLRRQTTLREKLSRSAQGHRPSLCFLGQKAQKNVSHTRGSLHHGFFGVSGFSWRVGRPYARLGGSGMLKEQKLKETARICSPSRLHVGESNAQIRKKDGKTKALAFSRVQLPCPLSRSSGAAGKPTVFRCARCYS